MTTLRDIIPGRHRRTVYAALAIAVVIAGRWAPGEISFITDLAAAGGFTLAAANVNR